MNMRKLWLKLVSNIVVIVLTMAVGLICFLPTEAQPVALRSEIYRRGNSKNGISLMFNVYWGTDEIYQILDILDKYSVKSTFFIGGCWADDNVACLKEIVRRGHELGNHGYFHKEHNNLNEVQNREEILRCNQFILLSTGVEVTLFAPPSGAYGDATLSVAKRLNMRTVLWSNDTIDWRDKDAATVYTRATKNVTAGALVLMHPMPHTVKALPDILKEYKRNGLTAITVGENLGE